MHTHQHSAIQAASCCRHYILTFMLDTFTVIIRTPEERADPEVSWSRPDERFFAAGACHILAGTCLAHDKLLDFDALMIKPKPGYFGTHVVVANKDWVFDWRGWTRRETFFRAYANAYQSRYAGWDYDVLTVDDPCGWDFCRAHHHRHPTQYFADPIPRAAAYLARIIDPMPAV